MQKVEYSSLGLTAGIMVPATVEEFELNAAGPGATSPKLGACLAEANANIVYRGCLADFRSTMLKAVELVTGVTRTMKPTGKKVKENVTIKEDGKPDRVEEREVDQMKFELSEAKYFNQVCASLNLDEEDTYFQPLADVVISGVGTKDAAGNFTLTEEGKAKLNALATTYEITDTAVLTKLGTIIGVGVIFDASAVEREAPVPKKTGKAFLEAADSLIAAGKAEDAAAKLNKVLGLVGENMVNAKDRESLGKAIQLWDAKKRAEEKKQLAAKVAAIEV